MQDRYVGDIGDFAKYSLLRALAKDFRLGVSWYLFPDEGNNDGRIIDYLRHPGKWRGVDPVVFDVLRDVVESGERRVSEIEKRNLLPPGTEFFNAKLDFAGCVPHTQSVWRRNWFEQSLACLKDCDLVFADPDNGLKMSEKFHPGRRGHAKSISECEANRLADGDRPVVIYHHNSRREGGHDKEIRFWLERLGRRTHAVRWRLISPRIFFILNCSDELAGRAARWCGNWNTSRVALEFPPR